MVKFGFKHSEKTREKMSLAHKGKKLSELHKAKIKLAMAQRNQTGKNNPMYGKPSWNKGKKGVMPIAWNKGTKGIMKGFTGKHSQDHKIPYLFSGNNSIENLITLCRKCHTKAENKIKKELKINNIIKIGGD